MVTRKLPRKLLKEFYDTDTKFNGTDRAVEFGEFHQRINDMIGIDKPDLQGEDQQFIDALVEFHSTYQAPDKVATNSLFLKQNESCAEQAAAERPPAMRLQVPSVGAR